MQFFLINLYYNILSMKDSIHSAPGTGLSRLFASAGELSFFLQYAQKPGEHQMSTRCDKILYFTLIVILMVFFVPFFKVTILYNPFSYGQFQILKLSPQLIVFSDQQ